MSAVKRAELNFFLKPTLLAISRHQILGSDLLLSSLRRPRAEHRDLRIPTGTVVSRDQSEVE
jgi:hypothetical protein